MSYEAKDASVFINGQRVGLTTGRRIPTPDFTDHIRESGVKFSDELARMGELALEVSMDFQRLEYALLRMLYRNELDAVLACQHAYGSQVVYDKLLGGRYAKQN